MNEENPALQTEMENSREGSAPLQTESEPTVIPQTESKPNQAGILNPENSPSPRPVSHVVPIDVRRTVQTDEDKARSDLLDLMESQRGRRILTGTIQGVERNPDSGNSSLAVIYHGDFKILIPAEEAVAPPEDYRGRPPEDVLYQLLNRRLGAEVDYIVKGIDADNRIAVASRLEAMRSKRRQYYFTSDRGEYQIREGICAEARVVSAIRAGIFVDLFGVEVYIPLAELTLAVQESFRCARAAGIDGTFTCPRTGDVPVETALTAYDLCEQALESCLKDVVRAMDKYATIYNLAPEGDYDVSFEWDDSILTDTEQQTQERLMLLNAGIISKAEFRQWYMGETPAQAKAAIEAIDQEKADSMASMDSMLPQLRGDNNPVQEDEEEEGEPGPKGPEPKE